MLICLLRVICVRVFFGFLGFASSCGGFTVLALFAARTCCSCCLGVFSLGCGMVRFVWGLFFVLVC